MSRQSIVIYHEGCSDGFTAAWIARQYLGRHDTHFVPCRAGRERLPDLPVPLDGNDLYVLDLSFPTDVLQAAADQARRLVLLDHHKSALARVADLRLGDRHKVTVDLERSGATLAWEHFYPASVSARAPRLVRYVEDRDLWRWALPSSREISAYIGSTPHTFEAWDELSAVLEEIEVNDETRRTVHLQATALLAYERRVVERLVAGAVETTFSTGLDGVQAKVWIANAPVLRSEVAGELARRGPFGVAWYMNDDAELVYSLRSTPESGTDVSVIAERMGGGGHRHSAGFTVAPPPNAMGVAAVILSHAVSGTVDQETRQLVELVRMLLSMREHDRKQALDQLYRQNAALHNKVQEALQSVLSRAQKERQAQTRKAQ